MRDARDCAISDGDIPRCPRCGAPMSPWVRSPEFLKGAMYREQYRKYNGFLKSHLGDKVLFLELGVGVITPMFIKEPRAQADAHEAGEQFIASGIPAAEWMRLNCISNSTFYLWFNKFRKAGLSL